MKRLNVNLSGTFGITFILASILFVLMVFSNDLLAQRRGAPPRGRGVGHVYVSPRPGFVRGHFIAPRIGAHIRVLPVGYMSFHLGGLEYYYHDGIYYRYYPADEVYVVVEKPAGVEKVANLKFDQVKLNDGSVLEGIFIGATETTVTLKVGDKNHEININDIKSINFAPAVSDPDKK